MNQTVSGSKRDFYRQEQLTLHVDCGAVKPSWYLTTNNMIQQAQKKRANYG